MLSMNFFALGFNLRTAFSALLNAVYVNCYPHHPKHLLRSLHVLQSTGGTGAILRNISTSYPSSSSSSSTLKSMNELLQKFQVQGYSHMIHQSSKLSLSENEEKLLIGSPGSEEAPGDAFIHSTCSGKRV